MDEQRSEENAAITTATSVSDINHSSQCNVQNFQLIWIDASIDQSNKEYQKTLARLRNVVNQVNIYTEPEQCIQYLNDIDYEKVFVITSGSLGQHLVPKIHTFPQVDTIYIFCGNKSLHEQWAKEWSKIQGVYESITPICKALQLAAKLYNQDNITVSFLPLSNEASNPNVDQLEPSFMYTQIFKDILLTMKHEEQSIKDLTNYCRKLYHNNMDELNIINEFEHDYRPELAIWWYTRECFTYQMINRALRTLEGDIIIKMSFFIRDLYHQIDQLYKKQVDSYNGKTFIVYRGQGLSIKDFEILNKTKGGLMSFNNFLSTSTKQEISLPFAKYALTKTNMVGILFKMSIEPCISATPFAAIQENSYFKTEEEILFSMHTVFRIGEITKIDSNNPLYQVDLKLTSDDDQQLRTLTRHIQAETTGRTGYQKMGKMLLNIGQLDKAEELCTLLLEQTSDDSEKANYYNDLGYIKNNQGDFKKALSYYEKALEIYQKTLPPNHHYLAISYNNIASVYDSMEDYSRALSFYEKTRDIFEKTLDPNHPDLATSYNNIGAVYNNMGEYSKALLSHKKALEIRQKILPTNHPNLATSYNNIGLAYDNKGNYSKALSFYEKALEIKTKSLPANHGSLATSYNNMAFVYRNMGNYSEALSFYERALKVWQYSLPSTHPNLQKVRQRIETVKNLMNKKEL